VTEISPIDLLPIATSASVPAMASTTTSFSGVSLGLSRSIRTNCCNRNALFVQPPRLSFFSAKPRSLKALKSLPLSRSGAFPNGFERFGRSSRSLVVRCDASSGRVGLLFSFSSKNMSFWNEFLLLFVEIALR
jgi:hypothetical protein